MTCSIRNRFPPRARQAGFSLIELMVAVVVSLIGTIVIFQVFGIFEGQKRTTTSAGDAQQSGLLALVSLERDARMGGFGLSYAPLLGCNVVAYDSTGARDFTFPLLPLQITDGAAGGPDTVTFSYGSSNTLVAPTKLTINSAVGALFSKIDTPYGYRVNDLVVIGEVGKNCSMRQVTAVAPAGNPDQINHDPGVRYNKTGGLTVAYTAWDNTALSGGRFYSLGAGPTVSTYTVGREDGNAALPSEQLMLANLIQSGAASPIVDGIVQLQAQYGLDDNGDGIIQSTEWREPCAAVSQLRKGVAPGACAAATATDWSRVLAMRIAVVARSIQPEKPDPVTLVCNTTTAAPTWAGGTIVLTGYAGADPNWQCYRYRIFETKVPLRNLIWLPQ